MRSLGPDLEPGVEQPSAAVVLNPVLRDRFQSGESILSSDAS
jgi:hypothetical protein